MPWPRIELDELGDGGVKSRVSGFLGIEPEMMAPRFEVMADQNPPYSRRGDALNDPLRDELAREFRAIPLGEAAAQQIRALTGQMHDVKRHLWGKNRPWPHGQGRLRARPDAAPKSVWPTCGPPAVGRRPPAPRRIGRTQLAALELPYSNGQVERQITKVKLLKRQSYGRAKLDLLRKRMLHAA